MWRSAVVAWVVLAGCGTTPDKYHDDYLASYCAFASDCHLYESVDACDAAYVDWSPDTTCFDAKAAKDCVKALDELPCPTADAPIEFPAACSAVYTCSE